MSDNTPKPQACPVGEVAQLWSDEDIAKVVHRLPYEVVNGDIMIDEDYVIGFGINVRDEYEAKLDELKERVKWLEYKLSRHTVMLHPWYKEGNE